MAPRKRTSKSHPLVADAHVLMAIVENSSAALLVCDENSDVIFANTSAQAILADLGTLQGGAAAYDELYGRISRWNKGLRSWPAQETFIVGTPLPE